MEYAREDMGEMTYENQLALQEQMMAQQEPTADDILINAKEEQKAMNDKQKFIKMKLDLQKKEQGAEVAIKEYQAAKEKMEEELYGKSQEQMIPAP